MSDATPDHAETKYAWRELARKDPPKRSAAERIADFLEIYGPYDATTAREQASRCVQCPEPICVSGCPLNSPIPDWLSLTAEGQFLEAAALLHSAGNMPEVCARLCPSDKLCEGMCILNGRAEPVSIWAIEQFLNEYAFRHGAAETSAGPANGLRVAVVGAGPGGLACADQLSRCGYAVTLFDSELVPGGLLVNGTPAFKLEESIVQRRIEMLQKRGVLFRMGLRMGEDMPYEELRSRFDAIYLAFGAAQARSLERPGADLKGVVQALPFLVRHSSGLPLEFPLGDAQAKRVVVLGGGGMAMDCLRVAIRSGAGEALCVYRRDQENMPCSRREYQDAAEEGAQFLFLSAPVAVLGGRDGRVTGVRLIRAELGPPENGGRRGFKIRPGTEFEIEAGWVILALGFDPMPIPDSNLPSQLAKNQQGRISVDENQMTSLPGLFAGGDIVRGPSTVLQTVRDARKAAAAIHHYLMTRPADDRKTARDTNAPKYTRRPE